jgi:hypothetical protein
VTTRIQHKIGTSTWLISGGNFRDRIGVFSVHHLIKKKKTIFICYSGLPWWIHWFCLVPFVLRMLGWFFILKIYKFHFWTKILIKKIKCFWCGCK